MIRIILRFVARNYQNWRVILFKYLSTNKITGTPQINCPTIFEGKGKIIFGENNLLGYFPSPLFYDGSIYIESRNPESKIIFGSNILINNNFRAVCDRTSIEISDNVLIGTNVEIIDSDFHTLDPTLRNSGKHACAPVFIGKNVFLGSNCKIMKGVAIGENSVIANGAIVIESIPENVVAAGIPAKCIKKI